MRCGYNVDPADNLPDGYVCCGDEDGRRACPVCGSYADVFYICSLRHGDLPRRERKRYEYIAGCDRCIYLSDACGLSDRSM